MMGLFHVFSVGFAAFPRPRIHTLGQLESADRVVGDRARTQSSLLLLLLLLCELCPSYSRSSSLYPREVDSPLSLSFFLS